MTREERIENAIKALNELELGDFQPVLTAASDAAFVAASELQSAWGDTTPDPKWIAVGKALILCSDKIAKAVRF